MKPKTALIANRSLMMRSKEERFEGEQLKRPNEEHRKFIESTKYEYKYKSKDVD